MRNTGFLSLLAIMIALMASCIKETYDMNRLSEKMRLSPTFAIAAATGKVTLGDVVKPNDTIFFDDDKLLKVWIRRDSVIEINLESLIDLNETFSFSGTYPVGEVMIDNFSSVYQLALGQLTQYFNPSLRDQFQALDDGVYHYFPSFPPTSAGVQTLASFTNFEYAIFSGGRLNIDIANNFSAPLNGVTVILRNADDNTIIGGDAISTGLIDANSTLSTFIELDDTRIYSTVTAEIGFNGSPGSLSPVLIRMSDMVNITVSGSDLEVSAGRFIIPWQRISDSGAEEIVNFDPGDDIEVTEFRLITGIIDVTVESGLPLATEFSVTLPSVLRSGTPFAESLVVDPFSTSTGSFSANNLFALFNTNPLQPYNSAPVKYEVWAGSGGAMIDFSSLDEIEVSASFKNLNIDYIKGYFGQLEETIESETSELEIDDILDKISGDFYFSNPILTVNYSNSFGIPVEIDLKATGNGRNKTADLNLNPFILEFPAFPVRDKAAVFTVDRNNSSLPELLSLPPTSISYSGSARLNPAGNTGQRDNYIFGDSRLVASIEATLPVDLWINNLQFADTLSNFLKPENIDDDEGFSPKDLDFVMLDLKVTNGFPLGVSVTIVLHDSIAGIDLYTLAVPGLIDPAPVNASGKVSSLSEKSTRVELDKSFFEASEIADKIVVIFTLNTTGAPAQSVKIYSDYTISFKAGVLVRPDITLK